MKTEELVTPVNIFIFGGKLKKFLEDIFNIKIHTTLAGWCLSATVDLHVYITALSKTSPPQLKSCPGAGGGLWQLSALFVYMLLEDQLFPVLAPKR